MLDHPLLTVAKILTKAKEDCLLALEGQNQGTISITVDTALTSLVNRLSPMMGNAGITTTPVEQFAPVTDFMGSPIQRTPDVTKADLIPSLTEKEKFIEDVATLVATIKGRKAEAVISAFSIDPYVIRGAALKAGLEDAETAIINIEFIERIKEGLTLQDTRAKEEEEINNELLNVEKVNQRTANVDPDDFVTLDDAYDILDHDILTRPATKTTTDPLSTSRKQKQPK